MSHALVIQPPSALLQYRRPAAAGPASLFPDCLAHLATHSITPPSPSSDFLHATKQRYVWQHQPNSCRACNIKRVLLHINNFFFINISHASHNGLSSQCRNLSPGSCVLLPPKDVVTDRSLHQNKSQNCFKHRLRHAALSGCSNSHHGDCTSAS